MRSEQYEIGVYRPESPETESRMLLRTWDGETLLRSVPWLRLQNRNGWHIYIRPSGEHELSLVDDLTSEAIAAMKQEGFHPAVVVQTSLGNYQAWLRHGERLEQQVSTAAARALAEKFGGDGGAADWRHFGRLSGFSNRKPSHQDVVTGLYPFVRLVEAEGAVYPAAAPFVAEIRRQVERRNQERARLDTRRPVADPGPLRTIEAFRADPRYAGDGNRIDLAWAIHALSHGAAQEEVAAAIRSRDLSKKGSQRRQDAYVERTLVQAARRLGAERGR
jgi:hypothetical protein